MKRFLLAAAVLIAASTAQGSVLTLACTGQNSLTAPGSYTLLCPGAFSSDAGQTLISMSLQATGSWSDATLPTPVISGYKYVFSINGLSVTTQTAVTTLNASTGTQTSGTTAANIGGTTTYTPGSTQLVLSLLPGAVNSSNGATVDVQLNATQTGVPEPSTMALLGSALVGLGLMVRRKK